MGLFSKNGRNDGEVPFDVNALEEEVMSALPKHSRNLDPIDYAPTPRVAKAPTAEDIGKVTAEAIKLSHEVAAEALTKLGTELAERVHQIELLKIDADETLKACLDLAEKYREKGRLDGAAVIETARLNAEAKLMIDEMRKRLEA
jgi:hypothetical protein